MKWASEMNATAAMARMSSGSAYARSIASRARRRRRFRSSASRVTRQRYAITVPVASGAAARDQQQERRLHDVDPSDHQGDDERQRLTEQPAGGCGEGCRREEHEPDAANGRAKVGIADWRALGGCVAPHRSVDLPKRRQEPPTTDDDRPAG